MKIKEKHKIVVFLSSVLIMIISLFIPDTKKRTNQNNGKW